MGPEDTKRVLLFSYSLPPPQEDGFQGPHARGLQICSLELSDYSPWTTWALAQTRRLRAQREGATAFGWPAVPPEGVLQREQGQLAPVAWAGCPPLKG